MLLIDRLEIPSCELNWEPLRKQLHPELCGVFMFMALYPTTAGVTIHTYKHRDTRRYLNIDDDGMCYRYASDGCYKAISADEALNHTFG